MKKIISLLLVMVATFSLIACGKSDTLGNPKDFGQTKGQTEEETVKEPETISAAIPDAKISDNVFDVYEEDAASAKDEIVEWIKRGK